MDRTHPVRLFSEVRNKYTEIPYITSVREIIPSKSLTKYYLPTNNQIILNRN